MRKSILLTGFVLSFSCAAQAGFWKSDMVPGQLRCAYWENPMGIDVAQPRLSWVIEERGQNAGRALANSGKPGEPSGARSMAYGHPEGASGGEHQPLTGMAEGNTEVRGEKQTAYQVLVASSEALLKKDKGDLWDSGKVMSDTASHIEYAGKPFQSRQQCVWKVNVWTDSLSSGSKSSWSKPASWEMGLLKPTDWKAKWIEGTGSDTKLHYLRKTLMLAESGQYGFKSDK